MTGVAAGEFMWGVWASSWSQVGSVTVFVAFGGRERGAEPGGWQQAEDAGKAVGFKLVTRWAAGSELSNAVPPGSSFVAVASAGRGCGQGVGFKLFTRCAEL